MAAQPLGPVTMVGNQPAKLCTLASPMPGPGLGIF